MKLIGLYIITALLTLKLADVFSQPIDHKEGLMIDYSWGCEFCAGKGFSATLYSYNDGSFFTFNENQIEGSQDPTESVVIDTTSRYIKYDQTSDSLYEKAFLQSINPAGILIAEERPEINWIITDSTRIFEDYTCTLAKGHLRGRTYYAWFNPDIKTTKGPWKLHGLPGAIIYAVDSTKELSFLATDIKQISDKELKRIVKIPKLPIVSRVYYRKKRDEVYDRIENLKPKDDSMVTYDIKIERNYFEYY